MRVSEDKFWQELQKVYSASEEGQIVVEFSERWATEVEKILDVNPVLPPPKKVSFRQALDSAFLRSVTINPATQTDPGLKVGSDIVSEALFLLTQVWGMSESLVGALTPIELNFLESMFNEKITLLNIQAVDQGGVEGADLH